MNRLAVQTIDLPAFGALSTFGEGSVVADAMATASISPGLAAWPQSGTALFVPVIVRIPVTIVEFVWYNGATVSGNLDAGIYDSESNLLINTGSTAQSGVSQAQSKSVTSTSINPGVYYLAMCADNTTGIYQRYVPGVVLSRMCGMADQQSITLPLPNSATMVGNAINYLPCLSAAIVSSVM